MGVWEHGDMGMMCNFVSCRRDCEVMASELMKAGIAALCYHAGLSDGERSTVQQRWVQEDQCKVDGRTHTHTHTHTRGT